MTTDQMRAEFEAWAEANARHIELSFVMRDGKFVYQYQAEVAFLIYAAGRKAEREAIQKEALQQLVDEAQKLDMGY